MGKFIEATTKKEATKKLRAAFAVAKKVTGGWMFFDSFADYNVWESQK